MHYDNPFWERLISPMPCGCSYDINWCLSSTKDHACDSTLHAPFWCKLYQLMMFHDNWLALTKFLHFALQFHIITEFFPPFFGVISVLILIYLQEIRRKSSFLFFFFLFLIWTLFSTSFKLSLETSRYNLVWIWCYWS